MLTFSVYFVGRHIDEFFQRRQVPACLEHVGVCVDIFDKGLERLPDGIVDIGHRGRMNDILRGLFHHQINDGAVAHVHFVILERSVDDLRVATGRLIVDNHHIPTFLDEIFRDVGKYKAQTSRDE